MKKMKIYILLMVLFTVVSCDNMDDNYKDYLANVPTYSPRVTNLVAVQGLKEATLNWINPAGKIAKKNVIVLNDSTIVLDSLTETYKLTNLEIIGYQVSVFTIDAFGNYSVPATINIFPNGE